MIEKLLPIGSVVSLHEATRKIMIIGLSVKVKETNTIYDYIGLPFPEGYIDNEKMFLFFAKDIKDVHFLGYVNAETQVHLREYAAHLEESK